MAHTPQEVRESVVLGHELTVYPQGDGSWTVTIDGEVASSSFATPYAAWAKGAAESYRQGKVAGTQRVHD
jgi:hypothetical protein